MRMRAVKQLLESLSLTSDARTAIMRRALLLVRGARLKARRQGVVESFLQEFSLSTPEGLALMGIAEALLRTPDAATKDRLIAERVSAADWRAQSGRLGQHVRQRFHLGLVVDQQMGR